MYLNKYFYRYRTRLVLGIIFVVITNLFAIYPAQIVRHAINYAEQALNIHHLLSGDIADDFAGTIGKITLLFGGLIMVIAIIKGVFLFCMRQTLIIMSRHIEYDLKNEIYDQYQRLDFGFFKMNKTGDLMNRISEDVSRVRMYIGPAIMYTINLAVLFILVIYTMIQVNPKLTLYVLTPLPVLSLTIYFVSNIINKKSEDVQREQSNLSAIAQESFSGIRVIKAYNRQAERLKNFAHATDEYMSANMGLVKVNALFHPIMILLIGTSTIITIFIGGKLAIDGEISMGNIAEFVVYINMLTWPVAAVGWVTSLLQRAAASQTRINEFLNEVPAIDHSGTETIDSLDNIEFKDVTFTYPDSGITALKDISFKLKAGQKLGIVGRTGSGKSTLANLICRMYDPSSGSITVNGKELRTLNVTEWRKSTGYVPQDVVLFSDTLTENIRFGATGSVQEAAKTAMVHDNIEAFEKGYDTIIGERGITLSGGQKQRVSIARAVIRTPELLILDDSLSAVDTETEVKIRQNIENLSVKTTQLLISHRIHTVKSCDWIIALEDGRIAEQGTHGTLVSQGGIYAKMTGNQRIYKNSDPDN